MNYYAIPGIIFYRSPDEIIDFVSKTMNVPRNLIVSRKRNREIVIARQLCIYLIRRKFPGHYSLREIGNYVGYDNDHGSVIHAIKATENSISTEPKFKQRVEQMNLILEIK